jgi:hypothetical protein
VNEAHRDGGFARTCRLRLNQLEAIIVGSGEAVSKCRGHEERCANQGARMQM